MPALMLKVSINFGSAGERTVWFKIARNAPARTTPMIVISCREALCVLAAVVLSDKLITFLSLSVY